MLVPPGEVLQRAVVRAAAVQGPWPEIQGCCCNQI
jgi:hypothetical protein